MLSRTPSKMIGHRKAPSGNAFDLLEAVAGAGAGLNMFKTTKDAQGRYTVTEYKRTNGTLFLRETLSTLSNGNYTRKVKQFYEANGTTLIATETYALTYDGSTIISEVRI